MRASGYQDTNRFHRWARRLAATAAASRVSARGLHHADRLVFRLARRRTTLTSLVSGLPVVMLTTTGARSGQSRTLPVLGLPDGDDIVVIASNFGRERHPSWYHNLRAHPDASVTVGGATRDVRAREATGDEWERLWRRGLATYPGWAGYRRRAAHRRIPIMVLAPREGPVG